MVGRLNYYIYTRRDGWVVGRLNFIIEGMGD